MIEVIITHIEINSQEAIVEIDGSLDSRTSVDFENYIKRLLENNILFILLDNSKVKFVSSEGIGLLIFLHRKISEYDGLFVLFNLSDEIKALFGLLGFDKILQIVDSRDEALEFIDRQVKNRGSGLQDLKKESEEALIAENDRIGTNEKDSNALTLSGEISPYRKHTDENVQFHIVKCPQCGNSIRINGDADYICPHCNREISINANGQLIDGSDSGASNIGNVFTPMIIECVSCKTLMRVLKPGIYQCPDCSARFTISNDQTVKTC